MDYTIRNESEVCEGVDGEMVWCGVKEKKTKGRESCVFLTSPRVWEGIEAHGWKGSRIMWVVEKVGIVKYALVSVYAPVNVRNGKKREMKFWNDVNECLIEIGRGSRIVSIADINGRVENSEGAGVLGKRDVDGVNENS